MKAGGDELAEENDGGAGHDGGAENGGEEEKESERGEVEALGEASESGAWRIGDQSGGGEDGEDSDVVLWAGADAIEAESAIEIADFSGEKQVSGATRLGGVAAETIVRGARGTGGGLADFDFER